ncbi:MAG TPA: glycerol-3-phosphate dehydrogenase subunit GlpB [Casimicrobiaceae bacterium]|nr:glycerol-3-phosphate dehydrogenase subunit GlpB [Casimicrobiaceae bacterium]
MTTKRCDVAVVGAGMAGMAASLFAAERGLSCIELGNSSSLAFGSGLLDLLGVHPVGDRRMWRSPFEALAALGHDEPDHPLARVDPASIRTALATFVAALACARLPYSELGDANRNVATAIGTIKTTFGVPRSMTPGVTALHETRPCLVVGFRGLREFSAHQFVQALSAYWPGLREACVAFPGLETAPELHALHLARALDERDACERTIRIIRPLLRGAEAVGVPAILGISRAAETHAEFERELGVPVFEIPMMPISVPGMRLRMALETAVTTRGVQRHHRAIVRSIAFGADGATLDFADGGGAQSERVAVKAVILATGRFAGGGLVAGRDRVREPILDLAVEQPGSRDAWQRDDFLDPSGHPINRAGVRTDLAWRPLGAGGDVASPRLFAAGSLLARQDWMRAKCGAGLAIATAWAATRAAARALGASVER